MKNYIDGLTGLYNMAYLYKNYVKYIKNNLNSYTIAIDFAKLKYINDNFGHAVGDVCLQTFSKLVKKTFTNSLVIRRSGDEFVIVTGKTSREIENDFEAINEKITLMHEKGKIPIIFHYNCGIKISENSVDETLYKADITMYTAKKKNECFRYYDDNIYLKAKENDDYISYIDDIIDNKALSYKLDDVYDYDFNKVNMKLVYIKDINGNMLFNDEKYELIKNSSRIKKIDTINIENIVNNISKNTYANSIYLVSANYKTLTATEYDFVSYLKIVLNQAVTNPQNICIALNVMGLNSSPDYLIEKICKLKSLGVKIAIDNFNAYCNQNVFSILKNCDIDYVIFNKEFFLSSMEEKKQRIIFNNWIKLLLELNSTPIIGSIDTKEEHDVIKKVSRKCFLYGSFIKKV